MGFGDDKREREREREREGCLGWGRENDRSKGKRSERNVTLVEGKWSYSVHYWLPFLLFWELHIIYLFIHFFLVWLNLLSPAVQYFFPRIVAAFLFLHFQSPDGAFLTVKTKTGLPALLKQLAQLHSRHRDTSLLTTCVHLTLCNVGGGNNTHTHKRDIHLKCSDGVIGLCFWGSRLKGQVMLSVGWWWFRLEMAVWCSTVAVRQ